jgi:two-component system NtrC family sensor kinase
VLQDLVLPDRSGIDVVRDLRALEGGEDLPIILLSTTDDAAVKVQAFEAGANDYVVKFPPALELVARIQYHSRAFQDHRVREQANRQLEQKSRIESLGTLAAGIAHEINSPLQYLSANLDYVVVELQQHLTTLNPEVLSALSEGIEGVQQISRIVRAMKAFAHPGEEEHVRVPLNELLNDVATLSRNEWKDVANLTVEGASDEHPILCSPGGVSQVLINLIINAAQAIRTFHPPGAMGNITLAARRVEGEVEISVRDDGGGIPEEIAARIFEPFFTTKERGEGSGQGLSLARTIIEEGHRGKLSFSTTPGSGTTFTVQIPQPQAELDASHLDTNSLQ